MKKLNLKNTVIISLIITLIENYLSIGIDTWVDSGVVIFLVITTFLMTWVLPFIPYGVSLLINKVFNYNTTNGGFKLFKILWIIINVAFLISIVVTLIDPSTNTLFKNN